MNIEEDIRNRVEKTSELLDKVKNKTTMAYLEGLHSVKTDYETLKEYDKACEYASEIIDLLSRNVIVHTEKENEKIRDIWVRAYDTRARQGDFEAFCIALEFNRPIQKQFYLPRAKLLKKHGLIQGIQDLIDDKLDLLVLNLPPRIGKELSDNTPVLTKNGWKNHGDLVPGDYVLNDKGRFVKVLAISPKCKSEYKITFSNGEEIECHGNHEWVVYDRNARKNKIIETKEMIGKLRDNGGTHSHYKFLINQKEPVIGEYKELPIAPYTLGAWLGDGTNKTPCITSDKNDYAISKNIEKDGYNITNIYIHDIYGTYRYFFENLRKDLQKEGMCYSTKTTQKHIPECYFTASVAQRLALLAGLLDTDGTLCRKEHRYHFSTSDERLRDDFIKLVSTFGWRCSIKENLPTAHKCRDNYIIPKKINYEIGFNPTLYIPCRLERKQLYVFSKPRRIAIEKIEPIIEEHYGNCIQVEGGVYLAGKTLIPTHNSTLGLFLQVLLGGMCPDESILASGHSASLVQSFYAEILNILTDEEYRYNEIFPNNRIVNKSAEFYYIDLNKQKRFHTYNYISIESGGTGKVQAERLLYCDDLVKDVEQANNPDRLEKLYHNYTSTIKDRKIQRLCKDGVYRPCPEVHVNTPWSLHDVTSRVVQNAKDSNDMDRVRIISVPCYDENGESNFMFDYGKGFDAKYYHDMEIAEDPVIFSAKYKMQPVERDGLVFNKDNVCFYDNLPVEEADYVAFYNDVAHGGDDYMSMPICYVYDRDVYIEDILFIHKFGGDDVSRPLVCQKIIDNNATKGGFEKNNGGDFYSSMISEDLKKRGYRCNITTHNAPTNKRKLDRILACQNEIKGIASENNTYRIFFKSPESIKGNKQYQEAMHQLFSWNQNPSAQNKQHDDFPDSLAGLITNILGSTRSNHAKSIDANGYL